MPRKLKVFRTPIGFHDAYVAATSRKAALQAWGADADLFSRGVAEEVTDAELIEEPLANPGKVVRRVRGSMAEHLAALPPDLKADRPPSKKAKAISTDASKRKPKPRPSRVALDKAEAAIAGAENQHAEAKREIEQRQATLEAQLTELEEAHEAQIQRLEKTRATTAKRYQTAVTKWKAE